MSSDELNFDLGSDTQSGQGQSGSDGDGLPIGLLLRLALAGLLIAAVVVFVLQNLESVPVDFLSWSFDAPLILLLAVAAVAGLLLRWIFRFWWGRRKA